VHWKSLVVTMFAPLTLLLAIGLAASVSLPTGQYKYESQILTQAPQGELTAAGLKFLADVVVAPWTQEGSYIVHFQHVHLASLNGISPVTPWSQIIHDEAWTVHNDSRCKGDLCTLTKPFVMRVKQGVVTDILTEENELQLVVNLKKGFAWEYQKLILQENRVYQQLPTHYGYCDIRTILKTDAVSEQLSKPVKKIYMVPVRETCTQYPLNTDSEVNEFKTTAEVMEGRVYILNTVQNVQLRINKLDQTQFITLINQTLVYQGSVIGKLPTVRATISQELVPTIDDDKVGGDKFVEKIFSILWSFTQNLTSEHGSTSVDLLRLLRIADKPSLIKLYNLVKEKPRNWTTLYTFLSAAESCEANAVLYLAMEEDSIPRDIVPEILERQYSYTKRCPDLISSLKKLIEKRVWDEVVIDKAYMVMSSLTKRYPEYIPEVWPIVDQLMASKPILAIKMAGNLGLVMRLIPRIHTRQEKILALETIRHSNVTEVPKVLIESLKWYANCSEHEEVRMLALKTYLYLSPLNESWAEIRTIQKRDCSKNIFSYIEDILSVTANSKFPSDKPWAKKACDLRNLITLMKEQKSLLELKYSRAVSLPLYWEKANMGLNLLAEIIHSSAITERPEDRLTIITLKLDTYAFDQKMEPIEVQLMVPTQVLQRIIERTIHFQWTSRSEILEEVSEILSRINVRIFVQNTEYSSFPNVLELVKFVYKRLLNFERSGIDQVCIPVNTVYRLPTSVGVAIKKQLSLFVIGRSYPTSSIQNPLRRVLEALPIVLGTAEVQVSIDNAYMSLKTGSRVELWNDLRIMNTELNVTESMVRIVKKLARWQDQTIFALSVTPIVSLQVLRPSGYFVSFRTLSVPTPAKRSYFKQYIGLRKPEVHLETTGYWEPETLIKPWTALFREQQLLVDIHFRHGSDEDLVIDLGLHSKTLKQSEGTIRYLNVSISRGQQESSVLVSMEYTARLIFRVLSKIHLLTETDIGIWDGTFEIELPRRIAPECLLKNRYLTEQVISKPWKSIFSEHMSNQTKYPLSYARLHDIIGWAASYEEMWLSYDNLFSEIMPVYIMEDTLQAPKLYELVKSVNIISDKVHHLKSTITAKCSDKQREIVSQVLESLRKMKPELVQLLKSPVEESSLPIVLKRELVVNWLVQKYAGVMLHLYVKVNKTEDLVKPTMELYNSLVSEVLPVWQEYNKISTSVIVKVAKSVSAELPALLQETSVIMSLSFRIMLDPTNINEVRSLYRILMKKVSEITAMLQERSLAAEINSYVWLRSQSMVVLQNVADITVYLKNKQPLNPQFSRVIRTSRSTTFKLYFTTLYLEKSLNASRYIQNSTLFTKVSELANRTLETIYGILDLDMYMKLSVVDVVNVDSAVSASKRTMIATEKVLELLKEVDLAALENPLVYVTIFDILAIQYHAYTHIKNAAKVVPKIVYDDLVSSNVNEIIKLQEQLDSCWDQIPRIAKIITLRQTEMPVECPVGQKIELNANMTWPTHGLTLAYKANLTKSWEQVIWEMMQALPLSKSDITYRWLHDASHRHPYNWARYLVAARVNSYQEFQIESYVLQGEIPRTWVETGNTIFTDIKTLLFPYFTLKSITLEAPVWEDSCPGVCLQGAVSERTDLVNAVFRLPTTIYTATLPWNQINPIGLKSCVY
ncbi:uncharacterized protein LOC115215605, partial [Argonauta hians]